MTLNVSPSYSSNYSNYRSSGNYSNCTSSSRLYFLSDNQEIFNSDDEESLGAARVVPINDHVPTSITTFNQLNTTFNSINRRIDKIVADPNFEATEKIVISQVIKAIFNSDHTKPIKGEFKSNETEHSIDYERLNKNLLPSVFADLNAIYLVPEDLAEVVNLNPGWSEFSDQEVIERLNLNMPLCRLQKTEEEFFHFIKKNGEKLRALNLIAMPLANTLELLAYCPHLNTLYLDRLLDMDAWEGTRFDVPCESIQHVLNDFAAAKLSNLHFLHIAESPFPRLLASLIKMHPSLKQVHLPQNLLEDQGLVEISEALKTLIGLEELNLSGNGLNGTVVIKEMDPSGKVLRETSVPILKNMIEKHPFLKKLYLQDNFLGDGGFLAIAHALGKLTQLKELDLSFNEVTEKSMAILAQLFYRLSLSCFNLNHNKLSYVSIARLNDICVERADTPTKLLWINSGGKIATCRMDLPTTLNFLTANGKEIQALNLEDIAREIAIKPLQLIKHCPNINFLSLVRNWIDQPALDYIATLTKLKRLNLSHSAVKADKIAAVLKNLECLTQIELTTVGITDQLLPPILNGLRDKIAFDSLILDDNCIADEGGQQLIQFIKDKKSLRFLNLEDNLMTREIEDELLKLASLELEINLTKKNLITISP